METVVLRIKTVLNEKIALFEKLVHICQQEKESLGASDVDALWKYAHEKQNIAENVEAARRSLLSILDEAGIIHGMHPGAIRIKTLLMLLPPWGRSELKKPVARLNSLKSQVNGLAKGNRTFVDEYLKTLDELIGIIARAAEDNPGYDRQRRAEPVKKANILLHREI